MSEANHSCDHSAARVEHKDLHGSEVEFWIACPDCEGYWSLTGDLDRLDAHISDDSDEWDDPRGTSNDPRGTGNESAETSGWREP